VIAFEHVSRDFVGQDGRVVHAVRDVSLELRAGETLCLIGTSGSGKTTLLRLVNRLLEPTSGRVLVAGRDVREAEPIALRRGLGWVIQSGGLFPHMSVARNVGLLCELSGWEPARVRSRVDELLELVHLPPGEYAARRPAELSGGQRQRVGVARALALDPPVVLMDEPFGALDPITRAGIQEEFLELSERVEKTILMVTHDLDEAFRLGDRVALMSEGELVQVGTLEQFREDPRDAYVRSFLERHL
jgi:osmoprotectant transport system ATP-binding protein